jgi:hypothetical protein
MNMQRREFLAASCGAGLASLAGGAMAQEGVQVPRLPGETEAAWRARVARIRAAQSAAATGRLPDETEAAYRARIARTHARSFFEFRRYEVQTPEQRAAFEKFAGEALIPALNRLGINPVGVFLPEKDLSPVYVLLPHQSLQGFGMLAQTLSKDEEYLEAGSAVIDAPLSSPAYKNLDVQLMVAFAGMPHLETPVTDQGRVFQLRTYESPSEELGLKKIEMFNSAELEIFRKTGLHAVFFGQTLAGTKMPNLTYMLVFKDMQEQQANWETFKNDPDWKKLSAMPEYTDILRKDGITNLLLTPSSYSQI